MSGFFESAEQLCAHRYCDAANALIKWIIAENAPERVDSFTLGYDTYSCRLFQISVFVLLALGGSRCADGLDKFRRC